MAFKEKAALANHPFCIFEDGATTTIEGYLFKLRTGKTALSDSTQFADFVANKPQTMHTAPPRAEGEKRARRHSREKLVTVEKQLAPGDTFTVVVSGGLKGRITEEELGCLHRIEFEGWKVTEDGVEFKAFRVYVDDEDRIDAKTAQG